jgi:hypothetical protein
MRVTRGLSAKIPVEATGSQRQLMRMPYKYFGFRQVAAQHLGETLHRRAGGGRMQLRHPQFASLHRAKCDAS